MESANGTLLVRYASGSEGTHGKVDGEGIPEESCGGAPQNGGAEANGLMSCGTAKKPVHMGAEEPPLVIYGDRFDRVAS